VAPIDDLNNAVTRIEGAVSNLIAAFSAAAPDLETPATALNNAAQSIEDLLNPPTPASPDAPAEGA